MKKLALTTETLRALSHDETAEVNGGIMQPTSTARPTHYSCTSIQVICFTTTVQPTGVIC